MPTAAGAIDCILFDLDGTLVDTACDLGEAANHVRASVGMQPLPLPSYRPFASAGARGLLRTALGITPEHAGFAAHRERFLAHYRDNLARHSALFAGVAPMLAGLEQRGVRWGIVTNKPKLYTDALLRELDLDRRAAVVLSADEVPRPKPAPDGLLLACARLGIAPARCLYAGDDKRDADAARAAGIRFVAVEWGYEGEHPLASWNADAIVGAPLQILELL